MKAKFTHSKIATAARAVAHRLHDMLLQHLAAKGLLLAGMKLKVGDDGKAVVQDGKPVYIHDDGREAPFDADATVAAISRLNGEAKAHREAKEAAEAKLKTFEGIEDGEAARKALETVKNLSTGDLKTAAQVQEIKDAAQKSAQEAVAAATRAAAEKERTLTETNAKLTQQLHTHIIGSAFAGSKFISDKLVIPADIAQKVFGDRFTVDDAGKLVAKDANGNPLFSAVQHGENAPFEEAIQVFVSQYAHKDSILKGSGAQGGGASNSNGGVGGKKSVSRAQWDSMSQNDRMAHSKAGGVVTD